jgi:hypothetical protein
MPSAPYWTAAVFLVFAWLMVHAVRENTYVTETQPITG